MATYDTNAGSVLGASTAVAGGVAALPNTGGNSLASLLSILSITLGLVVLASFFATRLVKRLAK